MEEADLLADEVAIMRKGKLAAFGSPLQLKSEHGTALQFSILVDKTRLEQAKNYVNNFFTDSHDCVDIQSSDAGTILVKIVALQDRIDGNGIRVETLTSFVAWLDDEKSPVSEYGFSNSSLEEVFLKVTEGDEEEGQEANDEATLTLENTVDFPDQADTFADVAHYTSNLSTWNQASVLLSGFYRRGWTGRGSVGNYCLFGILFIGSVLLLFGVSWNENPLPSLPVVIFFMSTFLLAIIGPIYADRSEGQFYLMKSQGLLPLGYIAGVSMYAFSAQFIYNLITLTGIFVSPFFWKSELCDYENDWENCYPGFGGRQQISNPLVVWNYNDEYQGMAVTLTAIRAPGGYGMVFGIIFSAAFAVVGQTLSTAFFPGYRLPLVMIMFITLVVSVLPAILPVLVARADDDDEGYYKCRNITNPDFYCDGSFSRNNVSSEFVDCIGFQVNSFSQETFCVAPYAALLSHFGIYQMLAMAYTSKISFISEPEGYVNDVLIPSLDGVKCNEDTCEFPFANRLYRLNFLYTIVGGVIFIIIGLQLAYIFAFPVGPILHFKQMIGRAYSDCRHQKKATTEEIEKAEELTEVAEERACVAEMISPLLDDEEPEYPSLTHSKIPRDGIAPVIMHRLRKVYPAFGGRLPKVALESLDLHVPKGEVLGLLGKNGAGKTTALKILAGAHDSSGGIGLVAGYDCGVEKISVFERLGNCAQFDVVWKGQSVQQHLEFFAALKGLPRNEIARVARATASAVGLGSDAVYRRNAGSLSGGMRRRLSIGMALIGSPSVVILDEPTTG